MITPRQQKYSLMIGPQQYGGGSQLCGQKKQFLLPWHPSNPSFLSFFYISCQAALLAVCNAHWGTDMQKKHLSLHMHTVFQSAKTLLGTSRKLSAARVQNCHRNNQFWCRAWTCYDQMACPMASSPPSPKLPYPPNSSTCTTAANMVTN